MRMRVFFHDKCYERLEIDASYEHGLPAQVVTVYRKRLQVLRAVRNEADLGAMSCLRFAGVDAHSGNKYAIHLNDEYRLIVELRMEANGNVLWIVGVREGQTRPKQGILQ